MGGPKRIFNNSEYKGQIERTIMGNNQIPSVGKILTGTKNLNVNCKENELVVSEIKNYKINEVEKKIIIRQILDHVVEEITKSDIDPISNDGLRCKCCNFAAYYPNQMKLHVDTPKHKKNMNFRKYLNKSSEA